jgi:hypothetical protein
MPFEVIIRPRKKRCQRTLPGVKPAGVLIDYQEFRQMEELLEALEDHVFGREAMERAKRKDRKWVTLEEVEKKLGLSHQGRAQAER